MENITSKMLNDIILSVIVSVFELIFQCPSIWLKCGQTKQIVNTKIVNAE